MNISFLAAATGATADAQITIDADTEAQIGSNASVMTSGLVKVDAGLTESGDPLDTKNRARAWAHGGATGVFNAGILYATATIAGSVTARMDGNLVGASSLQVVALGGNIATADTYFAGLSVVGVDGGGALAEILGGADVEAFVGSSAVVNGDVTVTATGSNSATATSDSIGGGLVGGGVNIPTAKIGGAVLAQFDGDVNGGAVTVTANGGNTAIASSQVISIALLFGIKSSSALAEITAAADVSATVGSASSISSPGAAIGVYANGGNYARAETPAGAGGAVSIVILKPTRRSAVR